MKNAISFGLQPILLITIFLLISVTQADAQVLTLDLVTKQNVKCNGGDDGSITVLATGGFPPYTYSWSNGQNGPTATNLVAGPYQCTVEDLQNATDDIMVIVVQPNRLNLSLKFKTDIDCINLLGSATVEATGGTPPYNYNWEGNPSMGPTAINLSDGNHVVSVTDANDCMTVAGVGIEKDVMIPSVIIDPPAQLTCDRTMLTINADGSSKGMKYEYQWSTVKGNIVSGDKTLKVKIDEPGRYVLEITNISNGCKSMGAIDVIENIEKPVISFKMPNMLTCRDTSVIIDASNSARGPNINYSWVTQDGNIIEGFTTSKIKVNRVGTYIIRVKNTKTGCVNEREIKIESNYSRPTLEATQHGSEITCDQSEVIFTGTVGLYITGDGVDIDTPAIIDSDTIKIFDGGTYIFHAVDSSSGCISSDTFIVKDNNPIFLDFDIAYTCKEIEQTDCPGNTRIVQVAEIEVSAVGGEEPYEFRWLDDNGVEIGKGHTFSFDFNPSDYPLYLIATDAVGCVRREMLELVEDHWFPFEITISDKVESGMKDGFISITYTGADSLNWKVDIVGIDNDIDTSFYTNSNERSFILDTIGSGSYAIRGQSEGGCVYIDLVTITSENNQAPIELPLRESIVCECEDESQVIFDITVIDTLDPLGISVLSYMIEGPDWLLQLKNKVYNYGDTVGNLGIGFHKLIIQKKDGNSIILPILIKQSDPIEATFMTQTDSQGLFSVIPYGEEMSPWLYVWKDMNGNIISQEKILRGHSCGRFLLEIENIHGCRENFEIFLVQGQLVEVSTIDPVCSSDLGTAIMPRPLPGDPGGPPFSITWSTGESTSEIYGLHTGSYSVEVSDSSGMCRVDIPFSINEPMSDNCLQIRGSNEGIISLDPGACEQIFDFEINVKGIFNNIDTTLSLISNSNNPDLKVPNGAYLVNIINLESGCDYINVVAVKDSTCNLKAEIKSTSSSCVGSDDGTLTIDFEDANGPVSVALLSIGMSGIVTHTNFQSGESVEQLPPNDTMFVILTDANGCVFVDKFMIEGPSISTYTQDITCHGDSNGVIALSVQSNSNLPLKYLWSTADTTRSIQNLKAGKYYWTATDHLDICQDTGNVILSQPDPIEMTFKQTLDTVDGLYDVLLDITGGVAPFQVIWKDEDGNVIGGASTEALDLVGDDCYYITIYSSDGCDESFVVKIVRTSVVQEERKKIVAKLFPNPNSGDFYIHFNNPLAENVSVELYDNNGKKVSLNSNVKIIDTKTLYFNYSGINEGIYLARIWHMNQFILKKVIVKHKF